MATRKRPCTETPAPPPMQMPSSSATCGFISCPSVWFSEYSSRKNLGPSAGTSHGMCISAEKSAPKKLLGYILGKKYQTVSMINSDLHLRETGTVVVNITGYKVRAASAHALLGAQQHCTLACLIASSCSPRMICCTTPFTSPPAQKAFSPLPFKMMQFTLAFASQSCRQCQAQQASEARHQTIGCCVTRSGRAVGCMSLPGTACEASQSLTG